MGRMEHELEVRRLIGVYGQRRLAVADYDELGCCLTSRGSFAPVTAMMSRDDAQGLLAEFEAAQDDNLGGEA